MTMSLKNNEKEKEILVNLLTLGDHTLIHGCKITMSTFTNKESKNQTSDHNHTQKYNNRVEPAIGCCTVTLNLFPHAIKTLTSEFTKERERRVTGQMDLWGGQGREKNIQFDCLRQ